MSPGNMREATVGITPKLPLSYGSPADTLPICLDTGSCLPTSLFFTSSPASPKIALEAAASILADTLPLVEICDEEYK